jgi:streptogrisin C
MVAAAAAALTLVASSVSMTGASATSGGRDDDRPHAEEYAPGLLRAMERDLGMSRARVIERLDFQSRASERSARAAKTLDSYAGSWVNPAADVLYVAVANRAEHKKAERLGARAVVVEHTLDELEQFQQTIEESLTRPAADVEVTSTFVDPVANSVVIGVLEGDAAAAAELAADAGVPSHAVAVVVEEAPRTFIDVVGGNAYYINGSSRCSVGFTVSDGFVTAGHCGGVGATTTSPSGTFAGSSFPGDDYAYVRTASGNNLLGAVNNYSGSTVGVAGSSPAVVGATVCRSGSTTGWHCGTIQAYDTTVTYSQGSVSGLIRTTVCAEPGDSGGSLLAGNQAQGVTSGGSGSCTTGGTTYFQPVNEILNRYGLALRTGGSGSGTAAQCTGYERSGSGTLSSGRTTATASFKAASGRHVGCLDGPSGADFDLHLQRYSSGSWRTVAQGITTSADERVTYDGTAGTYRWVVQAYSGSGAFTLGWDVP